MFLDFALLAKISTDDLLTYLGYVVAAFILFKMFVNSDNKVMFLVKIGITIVVVIWFQKQQKRPPYGLLYSILAAVAFMILWGGELAEAVGNLFTSGMDGGKGKVDKTAQLGKVESLRKQGKYDEAIDAAQLQLKKHKNDFDAIMLIASIQAEDMQNVELAASLLEGVVNHNKKISKKHKIYALNTMADWNLKYLKDPDAATANLEKIIEIAGGSKAAVSAEQRIAKMVDRETLLAADAPKQGKVMPKFERDIGLKGGTVQIKKEEIDPEQQAEEYVAHLHEHPNDWDTREKLAIIYLEHYQNVACAVEELEKMINGRGASREDCCRWLHMMADWQSRHARNPEAAHAALDRIIRRYPGTSWAHQAENAKSYIREN
ncbi:MAG: hypothetical protein CMO80_23435 [Verrucomicrobiales bacterium]|nr:hypothetical protein [Verrucomicrobiales bacterium]|tara:strand:- start:5600 stop:6727 length:1128 start_codon:yes stop_codon:yes gene_type:complete